MAITARKVPDAALWALVTAHNLKARADVEGLATYPHVDITSTTTGSHMAPAVSSLQATAASASNLATAITRAENVRRVLLAHFSDAGASTNLYGGAHKASDTTNTALIAIATIAELTSSSSQSDLNTLANALKTACLAHVSQAGVHFTADATNTVSSPDATDLASSLTLVNELYTFTNTHITFAPAGQTVNVVAA